MLRARGMLCSNKYELTEETVLVGSSVLHRIRALKSFNGISAGDLGGFVESEDNLSHEGNCWVYDNAKVYENARVEGDAVVKGTSKVHGTATVRGRSLVCCNSEVFGASFLNSDAAVYNEAKVCGYACILGSVRVFDRSVVRGYTILDGAITVQDDVVIDTSDCLLGVFRLRGNAVVNSNRDYIVFKNWWSSGRYFTWTRSNSMWSVGCFYGTGEELIKKAYQDSEESGEKYKKIVKFVADNEK